VEKEKSSGEMAGQTNKQQHQRKTRRARNNSITSTTRGEGKDLRAKKERGQTPCEKRIKRPDRQKKENEKYEVQSPALKNENEQIRREKNPRMSHLEEAVEVHRNSREQNTGITYFPENPNETPQKRGELSFKRG